MSFFAFVLLPAAFLISASVDRSIPAQDLEGKTLRELSLMRNEIYARHGQPFRRAWLREFFEAQPWYEAGTAVSPWDLTALERSNAEKVGVFEASLTREELLRRREKLSRVRRNAEQEIEWTLLNERLGEDAVLSPERLTTPLASGDLQDLSRRDLALLRHMIAARHGKPLPSDSLRQLFNRFEWYAPDPEYTDAKLSAIDCENLHTIAAWEKRIGGAIPDDDAHWLAGP